MLVPIQFHVLSFEGPDAYARAGGIATRVSGLAQALAEADLDDPSVVHRRPRPPWP